MIQSTYSDFDFNFNKDVGYGIAIKEDIASINQSIMNILLTRKGEVPFDPLFGSNIFRMLFEKMTLVTARLIEEEILTVLRNHEPRITVNNVNVETDEVNLGYEVYIEYTINYLNVVAIFTATLDLQGV